MLFGFSCIYGKYLSENIGQIGIIRVLNSDAFDVNMVNIHVNVAEGFSKKNDFFIFFDKMYLEYISQAIFSIEMSNIGIPQAAYLT